jgi:pimeloyl-ACP methyl ester carboxylesterase
MRALELHRSGHVVRKGVRVAWELFGEGDRTVFLMPTWSIVHAKHWKLQAPYLARHARVLVMDGRGNGGSDRPAGRERYSDEEFAADALAVMDALGTAEAALVSVSGGSRWALLLAGDHPERVSAAVFIGPSVPLAPGNPERTEAMSRFTETRETYEGWHKFNANYWRQDYLGFLEFYFARVFPEPHSTKAIQDCVAWGLETDPETLIATATADQLDEERSSALTERVRCPVLVIHGDLDEVNPVTRGEALAAATGGKLLTLLGSGHAPHLRDPVAVNLALRDFLLPSAPRVRKWRALSRPRRALLVSSPIGLGHVRRDIAVARELRALVPGLEIDWLAQHPVTIMLEEHGERIHPASEMLASESQQFERESGEHRLHVVDAWGRMDEVLLTNFMVFNDLVEQEDYDLWIGDEAWEIDRFLFENPSLKRAPYVWMTDFVGWLPMPDKGRRELMLVAGDNAETLERVARFPALRDLSIFIGRPQDVTTRRFGPGLPRIRDWTRARYQFSDGYVFELEPGLCDRATLRRELRYSDDAVVAIAAVGGSAVGGALLARLIEAFPAARARIPGLHMVAVAGPRLDPAALPVVKGVDVRSFVPDLNRHLAACDIGLVQGGLTTTMELAAYRRPFLFFPLRDHFEQQFHVRQRLERYRAGRCMDFDMATPEIIAEAMVEALRGPPSRPVESGAAARVAGMIAELL